MLVELIIDEGIDALQLDLPAAEELYLRANKHFKADPEFADRARRRVVALQAGDESTLEIWRQLIAISLIGFHAAYNRLGVRLTDADLDGESILQRRPAGHGRRPGGARGGGDRRRCPRASSSRGSTAPMIVRKRDGGYGYAATDLCRMRHRVDD